MGKTAEPAPNLWHSRNKFRLRTIFISSADEKQSGYAIPILFVKEVDDNGPNDEYVKGNG